MVGAELETFGRVIHTRRSFKISREPENLELRGVREDEFITVSVPEASAVDERGCGGKERFGTLGSAPASAWPGRGHVTSRSLGSFTCWAEGRMVPTYRSYSRR